MALSIAVAALVLMAAASPTSSGNTSSMPPIAKTAQPQLMMGVPAGEVANGLPIYRLPSIAVTASRSVELARMAREEALAMQ